nr:50S ribosomal protein L24, chloroplastic [Ipomoea batatas]
MAAMAALQSSFTSLSLSSTSFMGQRFSPPLCSPLVSALFFFLSPKLSSISLFFQLLQFLTYLISASFKISSDIFFQFLSFEAKGIAESSPKVFLQIGVPHLQIAHGSMGYLIKLHSLVQNSPFASLFGDAMQVKSTEKPFSVAARLKRWERKDCKPNSLPVLQKMHVKVGDTVKVIAGHDKGKIGEVSEIFKHNSKVVVKDINLKTKHVKSRTEGESGQIIKVVNWIFTSRVFSILSWKLILRSNVMLYSKEKQVTSRVGHKTLDNGKRVRYLTKTGEIIDSAENWKRVVKEKEKPKEVEAAAAAS